MGKFKKIANRKSIIAIAVFLVLLNIIIIGCSNKIVENDPTKLQIVTTIYPLYDFTKSVAGDKADVYLLLPAGADAHTFEPKPSDIVRINNADVFIYVGAGMEPWIENILEGVNNKDLKIIDASSTLKLLSVSESDEGSHFGEDPHYWLDLENDKKIVEQISSELSKIDAANKDLYSTNAAKYKEKLTTLDNQFKLGLKNCAKSEFITNHDAFEYLAHRYNLTAISISGITTDTESSPRKIKEIADLAEQHGLKYVFFEKIASQKVTDTLAREIGAKTLALNPGHNLISDEWQSNKSFLSIMEENLDNLRTGLECNE